MQISHADEEQCISNGLSPLIFYQYQLHQMQVEAILMIMRTVDLNGHPDNKMLRSLIEHFDAAANRFVAREVEQLLGTFLLC